LVKRERLTLHNHSPTLVSKTNEVIPEADQQTVSHTREKRAKKEKAVRLAFPAHLFYREQLRLF